MNSDRSGSPNPFDFGDVPEPASEQQPGNPFDDQPSHQPQQTRLGWVALIIAGGVSLLLGGIGYVRRAAYVDGWNVDTSVRWVALTVLGGAAALVAVVIAAIAVVRTRPRTIAIVALVCALILPWIALLLGTALGPSCELPCRPPFG